MTDRYKKIKIIRLLYALIIFVFSPVFSLIVELIGLGKKYIMFLIDLRIYYIPNIVFLVLTVLYIIFLKMDKPPKREYIIFWVLLVINILGLILLDILFSGAMGI